MALALALLNASASSAAARTYETVVTGSRGGEMEPGGGMAALLARCANRLSGGGADYRPVTRQPLSDQEIQMLREQMDACATEGLT